MNPLVDRAIRSQEASLGAPLDYLRDLADASTSAFVKFGLFAPLAQHRGAVAPTVWHLARLGATRVQDCGTCLQIVVNAALADGVEARILRAALDGETLPSDEDLALAYGTSVASRDARVDAHIEAVRARFGSDGLADLALAVATAQVFPILKRGLGRAVSCARVEVTTE